LLHQKRALNADETVPKKKSHNGVVIVENRLLMVIGAGVNGCLQTPTQSTENRENTSNF